MTNSEAIARIREHMIIHKNKEPRAIYITEALEMAIKALEIELLTDKEQRIFLKAMDREREVCQKVDDEYADNNSKVSLVKVCNSIERKVKKICE